MIKFLCYRKNTNYFLFWLLFLKIDFLVVKILLFIPLERLLDLSLLCLFLVAINFITKYDKHKLNEIERFYHTVVDELPMNFSSFLGSG